jgi:hypothetical protein
MSPTVRDNLVKARRASDRLASLLCMAGMAESTPELSGRLTRMGDDARVLAGALERMVEPQVTVCKKQEYHRPKPAQIASEASLAAAEQAQGPVFREYFINWAAPAVEDLSEPSEILEGPDNEQTGA